MTSKNTKEKERQNILFGIMCNGLVFPKWQANAIEELIKLSNVKVTLLIINNEGMSSKSTLSRKVRNTLKTFNFKNILWYFLKFYTELFSDSERKVSLADKLKHVPHLHSNTIKKGKFSEYFSQQDIEIIKSYNLDFILRFSFGIIRGEILNTAKYGIWSFHHDDEQKYRGGPPAFWEIYKNDNITGAILQRLTNRLDGGVILYKGYLKTNLSYRKNLDNIKLESSNWIRNVVVDMINDSINYVNANPTNTIAPIYFAPTNYQMLIFVFKSVFYKIKRLFSKIFFTDEWNIGIIEKDVRTFITGRESINSSQVKWLHKPKNTFIADPFFVNYNKGNYLFYESLNFIQNKGIIKLNKDLKNANNDKVIIEENYHLSYPFVFKYNNKFYCIPESNMNNAITLYEAVNFPNEWKQKKVLIKNFRGLDNTIIQTENGWFLFSSQNKKNHWSNLYLFYSESLFGEWHPHPKNPVKTDIRSARMAGAIQLINGYYFRPSMDYSETVEGKIIINRIDKLTKTDFKESFFKIIYPISNSPFSDKIHTINGNNSLTVIDGCRERLIFGNPFIFYNHVKKMINKLKY